MIKSTNNPNRETPIVAVTAYEQTAQLAGAFDDIISKPVTKNVIAQCIEHFCLSPERKSFVTSIPPTPKNKRISSSSPLASTSVANEK